MAELVDAADSKSALRVRVRVPLGVLRCFIIYQKILLRQKKNIISEFMHG